MITNRKRKPQAVISKQQISTIKMAQGLLGIADDDYRNMLEERYGVRSCTKLTNAQAGHFITELQCKGFTLKVTGQKAKTEGTTKVAGKTFLPRDSYRRHGRGTGKVITLATPEEIDKINALAGLFTWREVNGLTLFLERRMKLKDGKVRTSVDAEKAIEGLKGYFKSDMKRKHGEAWWLMQFEDPQIMLFIAEHAPKEYR